MLYDNQKQLAVAVAAAQGNEQSRPHLQREKNVRAMEMMMLLM
jgi:hypothetical protein